MSAPFVGRQREIDVLVALLRQARQDRAPAAALITGEPGSGKTRLLAEVTERSAIDRIVRIVGFEPIQPIPLAAVSELLRQLAKAPVHGAILEALAFGDRDQPARDPLGIFEAAHRALSSIGPLVLVIDDLQWLDELSLALVHYVIRAAEPSRQQLVVIAAARPSPAAAAFGSSAETGLPSTRMAVIELGPLSVEDGLSLARAIDRGLDESSAADVWRRARGSPFWVEALARRRGSDDPSTLMAERLRALSSDAGEVLSALSVGARPLATGDVGELLGWEIDRVRHASRELTTRGLALETAGYVRLAHDLIRESAIATLPRTTVRRLHGLFAELIEAGSGDDLQMLGEALEHRAAAALPTATLASRLLASPQRRLIGGRGLRLIASISDGLDSDAPEQLALDIGIGELAAILGDQELALERWLRVSSRSRDPSICQRAELAAARAAYQLARSSEAHRHLDRARAAVPPTPEMAVELDALQAEIELWLDHETAAGNRTAERALVTAREIAITAGGVELLPTVARRAYLAALEAATDGALQEDRGADVISLSDATVQVAQDIDEEAYVAALMRPGFALRPLGRLREAEARYRQAWDISRRLVMPTAMVEAGHGLARAMRDLGHLAEARQIATETMQLEARLGHPPGRWGNAASVLHTIELSLGDPTAALRALRLDAQAERDPHYRQAVHQTIAEWQARFAGARLASEVEAELAAARTASALARCPRCSAELAVISAELIARIGRPEEARRELAAWEEGQTSGTYPMRELWQARARAAIATAQGDPRQAALILEALIGSLQDAGLVGDLLWAQLDLGRALDAIDRDRSVKAFTEAAWLAEAIGALTQSRLAARELRRLGVRAWRRGPATTGDGLGALSDRELEVVGLVSDGRSNREIAESLLLSPKTVERHLTNVLAKVGLRNRTELASLVRSMPVRGSPDE